MNKYLKIILAAIGVILVSGLTAYMAVKLIQSPVKTGAVNVPSIPGVCNGKEPTTQLCEVNAYDLSIQSNFDTNGLNTKVVSGSLTGKSSTTQITFLNPTGVSTTLDLLKTVVTTGATTTFTMSCGTSTTAYSQSGVGLFTSGSVSTGTLPLIMNGITNIGANYVSGGTVSRLPVGVSEYVVCYVTPSVTTYWTTTTNAFAGTYIARFVN